MWFFYRLWTVLGCVFLLACGDKTETELEREEAEIQAIVSFYDSLIPSSARVAPLVSVKGETLEAYIKNGLRLSTVGGSTSFSVGCRSPRLPASLTDSLCTPWAGASSGNPVPIEFRSLMTPYIFEGTSSVSGVLLPSFSHVDEGYMYMNSASAADYYDQNKIQGIQVLDLGDDTVDPQVIGEYETDIQGSYFYAFDRGEGRKSLVSLSLEKVEGDEVNAIQVVDVTEGASPKLSWEVKVDGVMQQSRLIGDTLYLISKGGGSKTASLERVRPSGGTPFIMQRNEVVLKRFSASDLLLHYSIDGESAPLTDDCLIQEGSSENEGYLGMVNITAINLLEKTIESECFVGAFDHSAFSAESIYLTAHTLGELGLVTVIHKFDIKGARPKYVATGEVPGATSTGWNADAVLVHQASKMQVLGDDLAIFSVIDNYYQLTFLTQKGGALEPISSLPNSQNPSALSKKGNALHGLRFEKEQLSYVALDGDPFGAQEAKRYVVDFSDRSKPRLDESKALSPDALYTEFISDDYIFALGQRKAELFSLKEGSPKLVASVELTTFAFPNLANVGKITVSMLDSNNVRIAYPINTPTDDTLEEGSWGLGVQMLELNALNSEGVSISDQGIVFVESEVLLGFQFTEFDFRNTTEGHSQVDILEDKILVYHGGTIWTAGWGKPETLLGPITQNQCEGAEVDGLVVIVEGVQETTAKNCNDLTVRIFDELDGYTEDLEQIHDDACIFSGSLERKGKYELSFFYGDIQLQPDHQEWQKNCAIGAASGLCTGPVHVTGNSCHVKREDVFVVFE